ncbi:MAG: radical SAM protein [gamma proteobacterium symbiont of Taylorina sp.]|nr:radical SAM protein [gamma proteobacterium symbiont of Taylorina sp.]
MGRGPTKAYYKKLHEDYVEGSLTCLKTDVIKSKLNIRYPLIMNIEPTNYCNLKCYYCPRERADKGNGFISWELYKKIIDELKDANHQLIMLHLFKDGESFLHPDFIKMIEYAKKNNIAKTVRLNSNAVDWKDGFVDEIIHSGLDDITISIDAALPESYKRDKGHDRLKQVERNVNNLIKRRSELGAEKPFIRVKAMEFEHMQQSELQLFIDRWTGISDEVQITGIHNWSGEISGLENTDEKSLERFPCAIMWYSLVVNWDGKVTVCSVDWNTEIEVGDLNTQTINEVYTGNKVKAARRSQIQQKYKSYNVCQDCSVWVSVGDMSQWFAEQKDYYQ